jgi:hypothetical protein
LPFVDKNLKIVLTSFCKNFGAHGGLESIAFGGFGSQAFRIKFDLMAGFIDVPAEESCMVVELRASKPSGVLIMISSLSSF